MSLIIRRTCHGIAAIGIALFLIGNLTGHPISQLGLILAVLFGFLSALLAVKRVF